ncbi:hypothetical protein ACWV95_16730 [Streptomyces albus]
MRVNFLDADGGLVDSGSAVTTVEDGRSRTVKVPMDTPSLVGKVKECEVASVG